MTAPTATSSTVAASTVTPTVTQTVLPALTDQDRTDALNILHQALIETDRVEVLKHLNAAITLLS